MNCGNLQLDLPLYIDDILSEGERVSIEKHLPTCPLCRQKLSEYKELRNDLRMVARPVIPAELLKNVRSAVSNELNKPTIQIGTEVPQSLSEKFAHWILPYSVGTVAASILSFVLLTALMTTTDATNDMAKINEKPTKSSILLAKSTSKSTNNLNFPQEYEQITVADYTPELNPSGALMALTNSFVRGEIKDEEVVVVADVFNNGLAKINEIVEPPNSKEAMNELEKAFEANSDFTPFLPLKNAKKNTSVQVILKFQRVDVANPMSKKKLKKNKN